jgi:hypothetical protein
MAGRFRADDSLHRFVQNEWRVFAELLEPHCIIHQLRELPDFFWVIDLRGILVPVLIFSANEP